MFRKLVEEMGAKRSVLITLNGQPVSAVEGEPIAAVLLRRAPFSAGVSPINGLPRAPYCMMGACFACLVEIDGVTSTRSCMARARNGMVVTCRPGRPDPFKDAVE